MKKNTPTLRLARLHSLRKNTEQAALYQGTTLVVPQPPQNESGFGPSGKSVLKRHSLNSLRKNTEQAAFVSGHDFSRTETAGKDRASAPVGYPL
jgi:hypothetical protein